MRDVYIYMHYKIDAVKRDGNDKLTSALLLSFSDENGDRNVRKFQRKNRIFVLKIVEIQRILSNPDIRTLCGVRKYVFISGFEPSYMNIIGNKNTCIYTRFFSHLSYSRQIVSN